MRARPSRWCWCLALTGLLLGTAAADVQVVVNKHDNTLTLVRDGVVYKRYSVATGRDRSTPEGRFRVIQRWPIDSSGRSPYGTHWLGLNTLGRQRRGRIGIHGTNEPRKIGQFASHGCVRCRNSDIAEIYALVQLGTVVRIVDTPGPLPGCSERPAPRALSYRAPVAPNAAGPAPPAPVGPGEAAPAMALPSR